MRKPHIESFKDLGIISKHPQLTALEAERILLLSHNLARATAMYSLEPFSDHDDAMKKAEKELREFVYKLAGGFPL